VDAAEEAQPPSRSGRALASTPRIVHA
jgi:hypothetical protein